MTACAATAGVLCIPVLLGGVYGGGRIGSQIGRGKNSIFSVIGQDSNGKKIVESFRLINRNTSKKLKKELFKITGLQMGQVKVIE